MLPILITLGALYGFVVCVLACEILLAPTGYEDAEGFHYGLRRN